MATDPPRRRSPHPAIVEPLEPRLLLSADLPLMVDLGAPADAEAPLPHVQLLEERAAGDEQRLEVVFVDSGIDGYQGFVEELLEADARDDARRFEVVVLDRGSDGVVQITESLSRLRGVDAVHLVSHGEEAVLQLGSTTLSDQNLDAFARQIRGWGEALSEDADLLLYGCDLAASEAGRAFTGELARLTGADVAASVDRTGAAVLGGDWDLEHRVGVVETAVAPGAARAELAEVLATNTMYLDGNQVSADDMERLAPTNPTPQNVDPGRDADPGILISKGGADVSESDATMFQVWSVYADGVHLDGNATLTLFSAVKDFDTMEAGSITAYLVDCDSSGGGCIEIASATVARADWDAGDTGTWIEDSFDFGDVDYTLGQGRHLGVKIIVDGAAGDDMWVAVDSVATPSRLVWEGDAHASDQFDQGNYAGDDGSHGWVGDWDDSEGGTPTSGDIRVVGGRARFGDGDETNFDNHELTRQIDLSTATSATLSFDYQRDDRGGGGGVHLQVRTGGSGGWTTLHTYTLNADDASAVHDSFDLSAYMASDTEIRFQGFGDEVDSYFYIDNVQVAFSTDVPATNAAPVNTVPGTQQIFVDDSLTFSNANGNAIVVSDDAGTEDIRVTLSVSDGTLTLAQTTGLSFVAGDGTDDVTITVVGSQADINAALDGLRFDPTAAWAGTATLSITTNDLGNTGVAPLDSDPNLQVLYRFDVDGSDEAGSNDATFSGGAAVVADSERGNVLFTDGTDDYAEIPGGVTDGLTSYSFSLWIRTTESGSSASHTSRPSFFGMNATGGGNGDFVMTTDNGYVGFWTGRSGSTLVYQSTTTQINDDQWHQVTVTDDGVNAHMYVDGVYEGSLATSGQPILSTPFRIGMNSGASQQYHQGYFDDVRIFDRALSAAEVGALYGLEDVDNVAIDVVVNTAPTLTANSLTVDEGQTVVLSATDLAATDAEEADAGLRFDVSSVLRGQFELSGTPTTTFLQSDITAGNVRFVHDGNEAAPSYEVSVTDGSNTTAPAAATITFTNQNDAPVLGNNQLTITEGQSVTLTAAELSATDADDLDADLRFNVSSVAGGQFELSGTPTATFLQSDVTAGNVVFVHDGNEAAPSYQVSVSDGALATTPVAASVFFTNDNDAPVLGNNQLTITEGQSVTLTAAELSATDIDDLDADLRFDVGSVVGGQFELSGTPTTTFLQSDVAAGNVSFVHDGGEAAPSYQVSVTDGALATAPASATIFFSNQNDAPVLGNNQLTITEGQTVTLTAAELSATDSDDLDADLRFDVSSVAGGQFELSGAPTTTFLQSDVTAGNVTFVHDGGEAAPSYQVSVTDGALATAPAAATVFFSSQNDAPVLGNNQLTITEGQTVTLTAAELSATDVDDLDADLRFDVSAVTGGQFELSGAPTTTFLQSDVTAGNVSFVHDGGEAAPSYQVSVTDGALATAPAAATVFFSNDNDAPVLGNNQLTIGEGQTVTLTAADLSATDSDDLDADLRFDVGSVVGGQFELSGTPTTTFLQSDVTAGNVTFVHDGSEAVPSYQVSVTDGALATAPASATVFFSSDNDAPLLGNNALTITEGQTVTLTAGDLSATDVDDLDADLRFDVGSVAGGQFELSGAPTTTFLQSDVGAGNVTFVHDGGEAPPSYTVSVTDGALATAPAAASISFTNQNDAPVATTPGLQATAEDADLVFGSTTGNALVVSDADHPTLEVDIAVTGGTVSLGGTAGVTLTTGSGSGDTLVRMTGPVAALNAALDGLRFSPTPDYYGAAQISIDASDGILAQNGLALIDVISVNDAPSLQVPSAAPGAAGAAVSFSSADGTEILVGDVDASTLTVTLTATNGSVDLAQTTGLTLSAGTGTDDALAVFSGSPADVNAALDGLVFNTMPDASGTMSLQVDVSDGTLAQSQVVDLSGQQFADLPDFPNERPEPTVEPEAPEPDPEPEASPPEPVAAEADPSGTPPLSIPVDLGGGELEETGRGAFGFNIPTTDDEPETAVALDSSFEAVREERTDHEVSSQPWMLRPLETPLWDALDRMRDDMLEDLRRNAAEEEARIARAESAALVVGVSLLAGLLRSSSLFALSLSSLPLWMRMDPLAILSLSDEERKKREKELEEAEWDEDRTTGVSRVLRGEGDASAL